MVKIRIINGVRTPIEGGGGTGAVIAVAVAVVLAAGGVFGAAGAAGTAATEASAGSLPGNFAGDVADSLPGRDLATRRTEGRRSAQQGHSAEAWSRLKLKQLARRVEHQIGRELNCVAASSGRVRAFLLHTPCTSLDGVLLAVGEGHGNAAVVSAVRVGFRTSAQARDFQRVEDQPGSGDVRPLDVAAALGLTATRLTGQHYRSRQAGSAVVIAEADTATGHIDGAMLDAITDVASYLPLS